MERGLISITSLTSTQLLEQFEPFLFTWFPSILLIAGIYFICHLANKRHYGTLDGKIKSNQKSYSEIISRLESYENEENNLLPNFQQQKGSTNQKLLHLFECMQTYEEQIKSKDATIDQVTNTIGSLHELIGNMSKDNEKLQGKIDGLAKVDQKLMKDYEILYQKLNNMERVTTTKPSTFLNRNNTRGSKSEGKVPTLVTHIEQLNKTANGKTTPVTALGASASEKNHNKKTKFTFKKAIRKSLRRLFYSKTDSSLDSMIADLKQNLVVEPQQANLGISNQNSSSDGRTSASINTATETAPTTITFAAAIDLEAKIESLCSSYTLFSNQLDHLSSKYDQLVVACAKNASNENDASADKESIRLLEKHISSFYAEFSALRTFTENLDDEIKIVNTKHKEQVTKNNSRWHEHDRCVDSFLDENNKKYQEIDNKQKASSRLQQTNLEKVYNYAIENFDSLANDSKNHQANLDALSKDVKKLQNEHKNYHGSISLEVQESLAPSPVKLIDNIRASLSKRAVTDCNYQKLKALKEEFESTNTKLFNESEVEEGHKQPDSTVEDHAPATSVQPSSS